MYRGKWANILRMDKQSGENDGFDTECGKKGNIGHRKLEARNKKN